MKRHLIFLPLLIIYTFNNIILLHSIWAETLSKLDYSFHNIEFEIQPGYPVQLVSTDAFHNNFSVNPEGLKILESFASPISIISAVGSIHTGKSFLMNQILGKNKGFELGHSVNPGTSGIWMWSEPIKISNEYVRKDLGADYLSIILIDTEGFHGPNVTKSYDQTLYAITSLISTEVLFVSIKMLDTRDLEYLEELTKGANLFALRSYSKTISMALESKEDQNFNKANFKFPPLDFSESKNGNQKTAFQKHVDSAAIIDSLNPSSLTWIVQDFIQDLEGLTPMDWLNNIIDTKPRSSQRFYASQNIEADLKSENKSHHDQKPSHSLREMYENIECVTFSAPTNYDKMRYLDKLTQEELTNDFQDEILAFRERLFHSSLFNIKKISKIQPLEQFKFVSSKISMLKETENSAPSSWVSGADLSDILRFLITAANKNYFDDTQELIDQFLKVRAEVTKNDLKKLYESAMKTFLETYPPPLLEEVSTYELILFNRTLSIWNQHMLGDHDKAWARSTELSLINDLRSEEKNHFDTANLLIKNYCKKHVEQQLLKEDLYIEEKLTKLPIPKQLLNLSLSNQASKSKPLLEKSINQGKKNYLSTSSCIDELKTFKERLDDKHTRIKAENNDAIAKLYTSANKAAVNKLNELLNDPQNIMAFHTVFDQFEDRLSQWKKSAFDVFDSYVGDLFIIESETKLAKKQLEIDFETLSNIGYKKWEDQCSQICMDIMKMWNDNFRDKIFKETKFPTEEETLKEVFDKLMNQASSDMSEIYCSSSPTWHHKSAEFSKQLVEMRLKLEQENIESIKFYFKEPLEDVNEKLGIDAAQYSRWSSFVELASHRARKAILTNIEKNETHSFTSDALLDKVLDNWKNKELVRKHKPTITNNYYEVLWKRAGGILIFLSFCSILLFQNMYLGLIFLSSGLYAVLGIVVILELLRNAFQGTVTYIFETLTLWLGFEMACISIFLAIIVFGLYALYRLEFISIGRNIDPIEQADNFNRKNFIPDGQFRDTFYTTPYCNFHYN